MEERTTPFGKLTSRTVGADRPSTLVVLCHGYGAPGTDLVPLAGELERMAPGLMKKTRFIFPQAPIELAMMGGFGARAWWDIDVGRFETAIRQNRLRELCAEEPDGLAKARRQMMAGLEEALAQTGLEPGQVVLGGFSQGAMLTTDLALRLEEAPAALAILSGTLVCERRWRRRARLRSGLRILQAHGRQDPILPFETARWLRDLLLESGLSVDFLPFDGGHTIDRQTLASLARLIAES